MGKKEYDAKWQHEKSVIYRFRLNRFKHDYMIRYLETVPNISEYVRQLIDDDLNRLGIK